MTMPQPTDYEELPAPEGRVWDPQVQADVLLEKISGKLDDALTRATEVKE